MIQREHAGIRWELEPDFAPLLEPLLDSAGEIVKESPVKRVTRHQLGDRTFYLKRYLYAAVPLRSLKYLVKPTQARQEWALAGQLERRRVPIVRHLALGEQRTWLGVRESILITEGFPGITLNLTVGVPPAAVLEFVERLHAQGVLQEDIHPGNVLVRQDPLELRLVDLHGTRVVPALSSEERQRNLAILRITTPIPVSPAVEALSRRLRRSMFWARSRRCLRHNREFAPAPAGGLAWQTRLPLITPAVQAVLADPDRFLASRAQILKPGRTSTVGKADGLVLKRFNLRKTGNLFKDLFRPSRARRAFQAAYHLELAGVPTARPIAMAARRTAGFLLQSYFLMEEIPGAIDLGKLLRRGPPQMALVRQTAELIARLHDEGFSHRDLKESNLVQGANGCLYLLDLDGLSFLGDVPEARVAADLDRFARGVANHPVVTPAHRLRFLLVYCRARRLKRVPRRC